MSTIIRQGQRSEMLVRKLVDILRDKGHRDLTFNRKVDRTKASMPWVYRINKEIDCWYTLPEAIAYLESLAKAYPDDLLKVKDSRGFDLYKKVTVVQYQSTGCG